jgi:sec-independent protein translocase protein TatA
MEFLQLAFIQNLGTQELVLIFLVVLLFFGAKRMPELFRSFGKSIKEFKKASSDVQEDIRNAMDPEEEPKKTSQVESEATKPLPAKEAKAQD